MAVSKKYDVAVVTGSYTKNGEQKKRYLNVGAVWEGENGMFMSLNRSFNPAGVPHKDGSDSILLSFFEPRDNNQQGGGGGGYGGGQRSQGGGQQQGQQGQQRAQGGQQQGGGFDNMDDDIPF